MKATEIGMLRHIHGISYDVHMENTDIRRPAEVKAISLLMRKRRLQWHGHFGRKEEEDIRQVTNIQVGGRRRTGRLQQRWKDTVKSGKNRYSLEQERWS